MFFSFSLQTVDRMMSLSFKLYGKDSLLDMYSLDNNLLNFEDFAMRNQYKTHRLSEWILKRVVVAIKVGQEYWSQDQK